MAEVSGEKIPAPGELIYGNGYLRQRRCKHGIMLYSINDQIQGRMLESLPPALDPRFRGDDGRGERPITHNSDTARNIP